MQPLVQADYDRAVDAGVGATPTFIIGSTRINGAESIETFRKVVDAELAKVSKSAK
jgi:protein-disulfide isomerase